MLVRKDKLENVYPTKEKTTVQLETDIPVYCALYPTETDICQKKRHFPASAVFNKAHTYVHSFPHLSAFKCLAASLFSTTLPLPHSVKLNADVIAIVYHLSASLHQTN